MRSVALLTSIAVAFAPAVAQAQCDSDADCKGNRICEDGECYETEDGVQVTYSGGGSGSFTGSDPGWALPAAIVGVILAAGVGTLALVADLSDPDEDPSLGLSLGAAALFVAGMPVVFVGAKSARTASGVRGVNAMRIVGWIVYAITAIGWAAHLLVLAADSDTGDGYVTGVGALSALGLAMFSIDSVIGHREAAYAGTRRAGPVLGMVRDAEGARHPTVGASVRF